MSCRAMWPANIQECKMIFREFAFVAFPTPSLYFLFVRPIVNERYSISVKTSIAPFVVIVLENFYYIPWKVVGPVTQFERRCASLWVYMCLRSNFSVTDEAPCVISGTKKNIFFFSRVFLSTGHIEMWYTRRPHGSLRSRAAPSDEGQVPMEQPSSCVTRVYTGLISF